ncbi:MAG: prepilin-type N-terminal cleavage/methylation domain-containing protein [Nitrospirota bacterium]
MFGRLNKKGITLTELVVVMAVLSVLASVSMPIYRTAIKRAKETALRQELREMRDSIDAFKKLYDAYKNNGTPVPQNLLEAANPDNGYPKSLEVLTKPIEIPKQQPGAAVIQQQTGGNLGWDSASSANLKQTKKVRFLRKVPVDPMTGEAKWGMRSNEDDPDMEPSDPPEDVFDVFSLSDGTAMDGTKYKDW